jgi:hypothetical protein
VRIAVRYPTGAVHEVELHGTVSSMGRDPTCDLVLNDIKCSRRHAVLESGVDGITVRDTGSSNGVFVNGRRVERAHRREGDVVGVGDVQLTILDDDIPSTLSMISGEGGGEATAFLPKGFVAPPSPPGPAPQGVTSVGSAEWALGDAGSPQASPSPQRRPLTVTVLALLWIVSGLIYGVAGIAAAFFSHGIAAVAAVFGALLFAAVAGTMAMGLMAVKSWARIAQIVLAVLGFPLCPFSCASVAIVVYMVQAPTRARFSQGVMSPPSSREGLFTGLILICAVLGGLLTTGLAGLAVYMARTGATLR